MQGLHKPCKICTQPAGAEPLGSVQECLFSFENGAGCRFAPTSSFKTKVQVKQEQLVLGRSMFTCFGCARCVLQGWACADPEPCKELQVRGGAGRKAGRSRNQKNEQHMRYV